MRHRLYTVRTHAGIVFHVEAPDLPTAWKRAASPRIGHTLARLMREAVGLIAQVEPHRGPAHTARYPVFDQAFFEGEERTG